MEDIKGVILWVKNIANGERLRIHIERVKLEHQIAISDCPNARASFPIKVPEDDWKSVQNVDEQVETSDKKTEN